MLLESQAAIVRLFEILEDLGGFSASVVYQEQQETVEVHDVDLFTVDLHLSLDHGLKMESFHQSLARDQFLHDFVDLVAGDDVAVGVACAKVSGLQAQLAADSEREQAGSPGCVSRQNLNHLSLGSLDPPNHRRLLHLLHIQGLDRRLWRLDRGE